MSAADLTDDRSLNPAGALLEKYDEGAESLEEEVDVKITRESSPIKESVLEEEVTEIIESEVIETEVVESDLMENEVAESPVIETEVVENDRIENETVQSQVIESAVTESQVIESAVIESAVIESAVIESAVIESDVTESEDELISESVITSVIENSPQAKIVTRSVTKRRSTRKHTGCETALFSDEETLDHIEEEREEVAITDKLSRQGRSLHKILLLSIIVVLIANLIAYLYIHNPTMVSDCFNKIRNMFMEPENASSDVPTQ